MGYSNPQGLAQEKVLKKAHEFSPRHLLCFQYRRAGRWPGSLRNANAILGELLGSIGETQATVAPVLWPCTMAWNPGTCGTLRALASAAGLQRTTIPNMHREQEGRGRGSFSLSGRLRFLAPQFRLVTRPRAGPAPGAREGGRAGPRRPRDEA